MIRILFIGACLTLAGCAHTVTHRGLSEDGYGFTQDSQHLPPPADLTTPIPH
ncbi:hypothetical protein [Gluconobacter roseus]|uniref:hypothetical protein n=1 Tax=Gluconobacter roseus TaxID=586239 RepID=UPI000A831493|nr:hypothetical protein [Gluconobacter roseus]